MAVIRYNIKTRLRLSIHQTFEQGIQRNIILVKGDPEMVIQICSTVFKNGRELPMDIDYKAYCLKKYMDLKDVGEKVYALCDYLLPLDTYPIGYKFNTQILNFPVDDYRFIGFISMIDPPRPTVQETIAKIRAAGLRIIMITGDHHSHAKATARAVGIISERSETAEDIAKRLDIPVEEVSPANVKAAIITGDEMRKLRPEQLDETILHMREVVFARISPQQKVLVIKSCRRLGLTVTAIGNV